MVKVEKGRVQVGEVLQSNSFSSSAKTWSKWHSDLFLKISIWKIYIFAFTLMPKEKKNPFPCAFHVLKQLLPINVFLRFFGRIQNTKNKFLN